MIIPSSADRLVAHAVNPRGFPAVGTIFALLLVFLLPDRVRASNDAADGVWADRRPIAAVFLAKSAQNWPKNPRGYFADPDLDVTMDAGREELRQRMIEIAERTIARAKEVDAQGVVVWDIEGGEMPHAVTYLGDPRILPRVAPEMDGIADEFFEKFRQAGLRTGICIRPSVIVFANEGSYRWITGRYGHTDTGDPVKVLSDKIAYAKERWGCTNFYIDTNYTPRFENGALVRKKNGNPEFRMLTSAEIAELQSLHPDVLLWPEFQEPDYFATSSGYGEFHGVGEFSAAVREKYPKAFRVWMSRVVPEDLYREWEKFIEKGPASGEVFLFETSPRVDGMGDILRNAASELALRKREVPFQVAKTPTERLAQLKAASDWAERRTLIESLSGDLEPQATAALAEILVGETSGLQWFAARSLGKQSTKEAITSLREVALRPGRSQAAAIVGLGFCNDGSAADVLTGFLQADKPEIRWAALDALAQKRARSAAPAVNEFLKTLKGTTAVNSRTKAVRTLGLIGDRESVAILQAALKDPEFAPQQRAIRRALEDLGKPILH